MRRLAAIAVAAGVAALGGFPAAAGPAFPEKIDLPNGFAPEGIAIGHGHTFYVGSIPTGAIYRGDLRTGEGRVLVPAAPGRQAIGLDVDRNERLFVAGGPTGRAFVYDGRSGELLAEYVLTTNPTFVNDVVVTPDGAYFTDSFQQQLYRVPLGPGGALGASAETIPLSGDIAFVSGFNLNGIDATPNGRTLVVEQPRQALHRRPAHGRRRRDRPRGSDGHGRRRHPPRWEDALRRAEPAEPDRGRPTRARPG
jgi:sugar lactone lactonase YvrE